MAYYNRNCKPLKIKRKNMEYLTSGQCAKVYHNNEVIFKEYFSETDPSCRLSPEVFDILKDVDNNHLIKLFEIYSDMNLSELMQYKTKNRQFYVDAYTAQYYSDDSVNALYEPVDYMLDNFSEIEKLFDIFTNNSILTDDVKRENAILSHSGIIIIDPDTFKISSLSKEDLTIENKKEILTLFRDICSSCTKGLENRDEVRNRIYFDLADIDIDSNTDITHEISKKLAYVKKPIDYLRK